MYAVPILLNGEGYNLQVAYDFSDETWSILGADPELDESGMVFEAEILTAKLILIYLVCRF